MTQVIIGLGANRGDPAQTFEAALHALEAGGLQDLVASPLYESAPIDAQGLFHNAACMGTWTEAATDLLALCRTIEEQLGRIRTVRNAPRTIDLDILMFATETIDRPGLMVPHPRFHERRFALAPAVDLAPGWVHPTLGMNLEQLLFRVTEQQVRILDPSFSRYSPIP